MSALDYITINGEQIYRPQEFKPVRENILKGDYVSCTGKRFGDLVGWRYADMTLEWDALPQSMVDVLVDLDDVGTLVFDDMDGETHTESFIRTSIVGLRNRYTLDGEVCWKKVSMSISFIGAHAGG